MNEEERNSSIRKFLKMVGVSSQREIEHAVARAVQQAAVSGTETFPARMTLEIDGLRLKAEFENPAGRARRRILKSSSAAPARRISRRHSAGSSRRRPRTRPVPPGKPRIKQRQAPSNYVPQGSRDTPATRLSTHHSVAATTRQVLPCSWYTIVKAKRMTATTFKDSEGSNTAVKEVLSDDAYKRGIELAFLERLIRAKSAVQLSAARAHKRTGLESDVVQELRDFRSPVWKSLARQLEKTYPPEPDFGRFGKFREADR